jgi:hypothetical protein
MELFVELLKITIPALIVAFTAYYLIRQLTLSTTDKLQQELKIKNQKEVLLLRLQAYERLILLMERITPDNLVMRTDTTGLNFADFHLELLSIIRAEYDHNISQQLYVSDSVWQETTIAKEEIIKLINICFNEIKEPSLLAIKKRIVETHIQSNMPTLKAIKAIKAEARLLF